MTRLGWRSLRVRLPLIISAVIVLVLAAFLWTINRALEQTLLGAGGVRAQAAADQVAALMATAAARGVGEVRRLAGTDEVRRYLSAPSNGDAEAVRKLLAPLSTAGQPPAELRDRSDATVLVIPPPAGTRAAPADLPRLPGAARRGLGEFHEAHGVVFYDVDADVGGIGALVVHRTLSVPQTTETINRLIGNGAAVAIGNQRGDVWSNFSQAVSAPTIDSKKPGITVYRLQNGERRIGAVSIVPGTPWTVWVDFSQATLLAPARTLLARMLALGVVFVIAAAIVVSVVTNRITAPLQELTVASAAIAAGEFSRRIQAPGDDEIGRLGAAFNTMTAYVDRDHQELEARVRERTEGLLVANQELEAFSYSVSHDLRAPLRHVVGFAAMLEQSSAARLDDQGRRYLTTIVTAATRMGQLIDDLLAFSRVGRTEMTARRIELNALMPEVQRELDPDAPGRIVWRVGDLPAVSGDPALLRLVFVNLLSNAVKYSATRERPEIEVGAVPAEDSKQATVFVRDNGVGFDMAYVHKLFGVFQRLHSSEEFEGTGIGLANVRRIVTRHGGRVWAESVLNGGATFYVSLPLEAGETWEQA